MTDAQNHLIERLPHKDRVRLLALAQGSGSVWRIGASEFKRELTRSVALLNALSRYAFVLMRQLATSAACLRLHEIDPRLALCAAAVCSAAHGLSRD